MTMNTIILGEAIEAELLPLTGKIKVHFKGVAFVHENLMVAYLAAAASWNDAHGRYSIADACDKRKMQVLQDRKAWS